MSNDHVRKRLLEQYPANEFGTWRILGEDPNCDLGGHHHEPELETVTGTYTNVVDYALTLKSFFQWGAGGRIVRLSTHHKNIDKIVNNPRIAELQKQREEAMKKISSIDAELKKIGYE